jgi:hypothetical protein
VKIFCFFDILFPIDTENRPFYTCSYIILRISGIEMDMSDLVGTLPGKYRIADLTDVRKTGMGGEGLQDMTTGLFLSKLKSAYSEFRLSPCERLEGE